MIKPSERRRFATAENLRANYTSLPSVICDDFFTTYSRCLFQTDVKLRPPGGGTSGGQKVRSQVRVSCQLSELDESQRLVRRRLTQVREEEEEDDDCEEEEIVFPPSSSSSIAASSTSRSNLVPAEDSFRVFLQNQTAAAGGRSRIELQTFAAKGRRKSPGAGRRRPKRELKCYELFCVHQASLLVHRSQVLVEAERLSRRLDKLISSGAG